MVRTVVFSAFFILLLFGCKSDEEIRTDGLKKQVTNIFSGSYVKWDVALKRGMEINMDMDSIQKVLYVLKDKDPESAIEYANQIDSILNIAISENELKTKKAQKENLKKIKKKITNLKRKFLYQKDEFENIGFYTHKRFGKNWANRKTLTVGLNSTGYIYLKSNYYSTDWLFHNKVLVKIGENKYETATVERYKDNSRTSNSGGHIWEVITYENEERIIGYIANRFNEKISIRFVGSKYHDDAVLSYKDKIAIKESYELAELLENLNN